MAKNLKILLSGDSKPFRQEMDKSKASVKGFQQTTTGALDKVAQAFGVNTAGVKSAVSSTSTALTGMGAGFRGATAGSTSFSGALKILKVALISTGIGAIVVAFGALVAYFTKTQRGADKVSIVFKTMGAVLDVLIDRLSGVGEGIFLIVSGKFKAGADKLKESFKGIKDEMVAEGAAAGQLEIDYQKLQDAEIALRVTKSERRNEINKLRLAAEDETKSLQEQQAALIKAKDIEMQSAADEKALETERVRIISERIALGESMRGDMEELANAKVRLNELESSSLQLQRRLTNEINAVTGKIEAQTKAVKENAKAKEGNLTSLSSKEQGPLSSALPGQVQGLEINPPSIEPHAAAAEQMKTVWIDAAGAINGAMNNMAVGFGESIGNMIAGTSGFENINQVIIGAMADMAIQVGQIAIGAGLAKMAIDSALLTFGGGAGAVAAGIALVALGTAVKSSMASAAAGGSSSAASVANAGTPRNGNRSQTQKLQIEINGELGASGRSLALVLDNENTRVKTV